jgi:nucleoside-diphosphate-sugar epimerase
MPTLIAVTGAGGFIGRHLVERLTADGLRLRLLLRRPVPALERPGVEIVRGDVTQPSAVARLLEGADVVVHMAGLVRARSDEEFERVNAGGTEALAEEAARRPEPPRIVHVSSLAARAPELSGYARSKRLAEEMLTRRASQLDFAIVRPPAVYGPGDPATAPLIAQLGRGLLLAPAAPRSRFSLIYVEDLADLLAGMARNPCPSDSLFEPDDGTPGGYAWADLARIAGEVTGRRVRILPAPRWALAPVAFGADLWAAWSGRASVFGHGKLAELFHPDWVADAGSCAALPWRPRTTFASGFQATLGWLRAGNGGKSFRAGRLPHGSRSP